MNRLRRATNGLLHAAEDELLSDWDQPYSDVRYRSLVNWHRLEDATPLTLTRIN